MPKRLLDSPLRCQQSFNPTHPTESSPAHHRYPKTISFFLPFSHKLSKLPYHPTVAQNLGQVDLCSLFPRPESISHQAPQAVMSSVPALPQSWFCHPRPRHQHFLSGLQHQPKNQSSQSAPLPMHPPAQPGAISVNLNLSLSSPHPHPQLFSQALRTRANSSTRPTRAAQLLLPPFQNTTLHFFQFPDHALGRFLSKQARLVNG